jgi:hypothetical protein
LVCNTGGNTAYVLMGNSSVAATTSNFAVLAGACNTLAVNGSTYLAAITASSTTTLLISNGTGSASNGGGASGGGVPQPVVNGECLIGAGGIPVWGSCSGAGTSVTSVTGTAGQITADPTTGDVILTLPPTITEALTFNNNLTTTYIQDTDLHLEIDKIDSPVNFYGNAWAGPATTFQFSQDQDLPADQSAPAFMFLDYVTGNGVITAGVSRGFWPGISSIMDKVGDGSAQAFTANGIIETVGPGGYNEICGFCGTAMNKSSTNGQAAGVEVFAADSNDAGVTHNKTVLHGVDSRVAKFDTTIASTDHAKSNSFMATSEGSQPVGSVLYANDIAGHGWDVGIDLASASFTTNVGLALGTHTISGMTVASLPALTASHFLAGDVSNRPIDASITGDLGCGTAAAGFITCTNTGLQGRAVFSGAPSDTNVLAWSASNSRWQPTAAGSGTGTVTSVAASVPASSILGISGSPITTSGTLGLTTTGTSGGVPYFFDGNTLKTSAALTANLPMIGGGAGAAPSVGTRSGNTTAFVTTTGTQTSGKCVTIDANGNHVADSAACGGGGSLTVTDGTHSVASTTTLTVGNGFLVGGSAGAATLDATNTLNTQSGTGAYAILAGDAGLQVVRTNASGGADTIAAASTTNFTAGYSTMYTANGQAGNTITPASGTIGGLSVLKLGKNQSVSLDSDGTNYNVAASVPIPATQTGSTLLHDDMTWSALPTASTSTAGIAKLHNVPLSVGWIATINPNKAIIATVHQASRISAIIGRVSDATNNGTATVAVYKAPSGTACSAGTILHSGTLDANGTANTNQTLTLVGGATDDLADGDSLCLVTTGTTSWTGGAGIGSVSVFLAPI